MAAVQPLASTDTLLAVDQIATSYGKRRVLWDVSLTVRRGEIVTVLGHNGAGKTTMLKAVFGLLPLQGGKVSFDGRDVSGQSHVRNVRQGMSFVPAEAPIFRDLSVADNLGLGAFTVADDDLKNKRLRRVFELFPILEQRRSQVSGTLSGGQQRMLSLGISLMAGPRLMLLDEPSLGIAPGLVQQIFEVIQRLTQEEGLSALMVEQNVRAALRVANRAFFMRAGRILLEEPAEKALARGKWWDLF